MDEVLFRYRPKRVRTVLFAAFLLGMSLFSAVQARDNDRGVTINYIITLGPDGARIFYWFIAIGVWIITLIVIADVATAFGRGKRHLVVGSATLTIPRRLGLKPHVIAYSDIVELRIGRRSWEYILLVDHFRGVAEIEGGYLPHAKDLDHVAGLIAAGMRAARG
jgi:hypothetical protein